MSEPDKCEELEVWVVCLHCQMKTRLGDEPKHWFCNNCKKPLPGTKWYAWKTGAIRRRANEVLKIFNCYAAKGSGEGMIDYGEGGMVNSSEGEFRSKFSRMEVLALVREVYILRALLHGLVGDNDTDEL